MRSPRAEGSHRLPGLRRRLTRSDHLGRISMQRGTTAHPARYRLPHRPDNLKLHFFFVTNSCHGLLLTGVLSVFAGVGFPCLDACSHLSRLLQEKTSTRHLPHTAPLTNRSPWMRRPIRPPGGWERGGGEGGGGQSYTKCTSDSSRTTSERTSPTQPTVAPTLGHRTTSSPPGAVQSREERRRLAWG